MRLASSRALPHLASLCAARASSARAAAGACFGGMAGPVPGRWVERRVDMLMARLGTDTYVGPGTASVLGDAPSVATVLLACPPLHYLTRAPRRWVDRFRVRQARSNAAYRRGSADGPRDRTSHKGRSLPFCRTLRRDRRPTPDGRVGPRALGRRWVPPPYSVRSCGNGTFRRGLLGLCGAAA